MQYQAFPTSQSRKKQLRLRFRKSPKNDQVWDPGAQGEGEILKCQFQPFLFAN